MSTIEKAILQIHLSASRQTDGARIEPRIQMVVVLAFIICTLSIPVDDPASLLWLFSFPIIMSEAVGIGYARVFTRSLWIVPLIAVIGIFNPFLDRAVVWQIGHITIDRGWLTFVSLLLRGLLAYQALLILIYSYGFYDICRCLQFFRVPNVLVTQLLMLYRYIGVMLRESLSMHRARQARGYGKEHYPLRMWGIFIGQLFIRSVNRAKRVHAAMLARGFTGVYHFSPFSKAPSAKDYVYLAVWIVVFALIRYYDLTALMAKFVTRY